MIMMFTVIRVDSGNSGLVGTCLRKPGEVQVHISSPLRLRSD